MKFNFKTKAKVARTTNYEGEKAYKVPARLELYSLVATSMLNDQFYEGTDERLIRLRKLVKSNDAEFVAKLAVYARTEMNMRSIPLVLAVELAKIHGGDGLVGRMVNGVVQRADEIMELLAYYSAANNRDEVKKLNKLSRQVQKGLGMAFNKFDEYQFAKYNRDAQIKLKDALFIVHPKPKDLAQQGLFDKIVNDELKTPYTWEVELSAVGQRKFESDKARETAVREKWEELIVSKKLGYMATMRNLRNILEAGVSREAVDAVCAYLSDPVAVAKSKQLPFRFLSAYRELKEAKIGWAAKVLDALEAAVVYATANVKGYDDDTRVVIAADVSGSMQKPVSAKSKVLNYDIGLMLAMLLRNRCKYAITGMFGDSWKQINMPSTGILANVQEFYKREGEVGYSTNGYLVVQDLLQRGQVVDKIMMFTDCQLWDSKGTGVSFPGLWSKYKDIAPNAKLYLFDLAGYGTTPLNVLRDDVFLIAGWSDKIFDVLQALEEGGGAIEKINKIEL